MATITKSAPSSNSQSLSDRIKDIESKLANGDFYTSKGLKNSLTTLEKQLYEAVTPPEVDEARDLIADHEIIIAMAEQIESFPPLLRSLFLADQLKQDVEATADQVQEVAFTLESMMNDDIPREVTIEILGDVVPVSISFDDRKVDYKLVSYKDGEATYAIA